MIVSTDVVVDLQHGDTGKGKITNRLAQSGQYNVVIRYNGGGNAGHTVYWKNKKVVTHQIPVGVLYGITSIIGSGCVVDVKDLITEIEYLEELGVSNVRSLLKIDSRAHLVTDAHREEDSTDVKIGTTRKGIGPAYRDKYNRTGIRAETLHDHPVFGSMLIDGYQYLHNTPQNEYSILCEGAQGFYLDIDMGDYPYVTSSHCTVGSACLNGIPPQTIKRVIGIMKAYETYVGNKTTFTDMNDSIFQKIQELGHEFGATTGRPRLVRWIVLDDVIKAIKINGVTDLFINKTDILDLVGAYKFMYKGQLFEFDNRIEFEDWIRTAITLNCGSTVVDITFADGVK
jgi:adenylosuccinate synthase